MKIDQDIGNLMKQNQQIKAQYDKLEVIALLFFGLILGTKICIYLVRKGRI